MGSSVNHLSSSESAVKTQLRQFILENLAQPKGVTSFADDELLMEKGIIDSLGIFRLISFLEDEFAIRVDDQEINSETFASLNTIEKLVSKRKA